MSGGGDADALLALLEEIHGRETAPTHFTLQTKHKADPKYELGPSSADFAKEEALHQLQAMARLLMGRKKTEEVEAALLELAFGTVAVSSAEARVALTLSLLEGLHLTEAAVGKFPVWRVKALLALVELFQEEARNSDSKRSSFMGGGARPSPSPSMGDVALFAGGERGRPAKGPKGGTGFLKAKLTQHLKSRPTLEDLQDRNIVAGGVAAPAGGKPARHTIIPDMPPAGLVLSWEELLLTRADDASDATATAASSATPQLVTSSIACAEEGKEMRYLVEYGGHYDNLPGATSELAIEDTAKDEPYFQKHFASKGIYLGLS